jgi:vacuolar-type H+-ATPase subunit I/STV1
MEDMMEKIEEKKPLTPEEAAAKIKVLCEQLQVTEDVARKLLKVKEKIENESGEIKMMRACLDKLLELRAVATKLNEEYQMVQEFLTKCFENVEENGELVDSINTDLESVADNLKELLKIREVPK